ncbi:DEAD-box ATP-dependent RNA helicase 5 [Linum grandiflorum]
MGKKLQEEAAQVDDESMRLEKKKNKKKKQQQKEAAEVEEQLNGKHAKRKQDDANDAEQGSRKKEKKKRKKNREEKHVTQDAEIGVADEEAAAQQGTDEDKIVVTGKDAHESKYRPLKSFVESKLPEKVLECCQGFENPSPIQSHAWPFLLDGRDFIGIAKTGSGKTLAYGIPAIMHVMSKRKGRVERGAIPLCLVLAPTRELADQIFVVLRDAGEPTGIRSLCVYGGTPKGPQISSLKSGVDIVIGTPGRLRDLMEMEVCHLKDVSFVVLDEADRMLDMGFRQEVQAILSTTASARQMIMFSATWPLDVHKLAEEHMDPNPVKVVVGSEDTAANHDVMQIVEVVDDRLRDDRLLTLLEKYHKTQKNRVIVFALYQKEAERLEGMLRRSGWKVVGIHGNKAQAQRTNALSLFKTGSCPLMVATDVAARGLDVPDVEVVINYSFPLTTEDYVHRIGRTGRAGKKGVAHTFFTHHNKGLAGELVNVLREAKQIVPESLLKFGTHVKKKESKLYGAHFRELGADAPKAKKITFNSDDED